jgi:nudix-type nucleoside diphosphatase (YffH/AdpP family)
MSKPGHVEIVSTEILSKWWGTASRVTLRHTRSDGRVETLAREVYDHGHAAAVLPVDRQRGTVLLVKQMRIPAWLCGSKDPLVEACAGLLDGDDPVDCVLREGIEELGYRLHDPRLIANAYASPGSLTERVALYLASYAPADRIGDGGGVHHEGEDIEVVEMPLAEAFDLIASGDIVDMKTIVLLQAAKLAANSNQ